MKREFRRNNRLQWVFLICKNLGIDDPVTWFNAVPPQVVDQWIAFEIVRAEDQDGKGKKGMVSPLEALQQINERLANG